MHTMVYCNTYQERARKVWVGRSSSLRVCCVTYICSIQIQCIIETKCICTILIHIDIEFGYWMCLDRREMYIHARVDDIRTYWYLYGGLWVDDGVFVWGGKTCSVSHSRSALHAYLVLRLWHTFAARRTKLVQDWR